MVWNLYISPSDIIIQHCIAIAGGMMVASSYSLFMEGLETGDIPGMQECFASIVCDIEGRLAGFYGFHPVYRTVLGAFFGIVFLIVTKKFMDAYEDVKVDIFGGASSQRMFLIMFVMTLHSISEGVGIGVSFGKWPPQSLSRKNRRLLTSSHFIPILQVVLTESNWDDSSLSHWLSITYRRDWQWHWYSILEVSPSYAQV